MAKKTKPLRFILLPARGVQAKAANASRMTSDFLVTLHARKVGAAQKVVAAGAPTIRVIDSVHEDGAKLVEMRPADVVKLRAAQPGLRIVPEVFYYPALAPRPLPIAPPGLTKMAKSSKTVRAMKTTMSLQAAVATIRPGEFRSLPIP